MPDPQAPIRPVSRQRAAQTSKLAKWREAVAKRAGYVCETFTDRFDLTPLSDKHRRMLEDGCWGRGEQAHHQRGRVGPDLTDLVNGVWLCGPCHDFVTLHPEAAYASGLSKKRLGKRDDQ